MSKSSAEDYAFNEGDSTLPRVSMPNANEQWEKAQNASREPGIPFDQFTPEQSLLADVLSRSSEPEAQDVSPVMMLSADEREVLDELLAEGDKEWGI